MLILTSECVFILTFTATTQTYWCVGVGQSTTITPSPLPLECTNYLNISDVTRRAYYEFGGTSCDDVRFPSAMWIRFIGSGGSLLANCPIPYRHCGATSPGWYSGVYPSIIGTSTIGDVCFNWGTNTCMWRVTIQITFCNGFFVFELSPPPICDARYCTI